MKVHFIAIGGSAMHNLAIARGGHTLLYGGSNLGLMGALPHNATPHPCAVKLTE